MGCLVATAFLLGGLLIAGPVGAIIGLLFAIVLGLFAGKRG